MWTIIKMQARTMRRNPSIFFIVIFPIVMVSVLSSVAINTAGSDQIAQEAALLGVLASVLVITILSSVNNYFGSNFMELKQSIIIKRLGSTQVTKTDAMAGFLLWALILAISQTFYTLFLFWLIGATGLTDFNILYNENINWIAVAYGIVLLIILSFSIVFAMMAFAPTGEMYQLMSLLYFFLIMYFGGLLFTTTNIAWMNTVSLFLPHSYIANFLSGAFTNGVYMDVQPGEVPISTGISVWDFGNWTNEYIIDGQSSLNLVMPVLLSIGFGWIGIRRFQWDS